MEDPRRALRLALNVALLCLVPALAAAQTATLAWDPSAGAQGYILKWGTKSGTYPNSIDAGNTTSTTVIGLTPGASYWAVVQAYDETGAFSNPSNVLSFVAPVPCTYAVNPLSISIYAGATDGTLYVQTPMGCPWSAGSHNSFLTLLNGGGRVGPGPLPVLIDGNYTNTARTGTATIAGLTFTVNQMGTPVDPVGKIRENARADFDGNGSTDILWQDMSGNLAAWMLEGDTIIARESLTDRMVDSDWRVAGTGDFNGDGKPDIVWHHRTGGWVYVWYMDGLTQTGGTYLSMQRMPSSGWSIVGVGDFNADGQPDIVWQHPTEGWLSVWLVNATVVSNVPMSPNRLLDAPWQIVAVGDFNADGSSDLLWRHSQTGHMGVWLMDGLTRRGYVSLNPYVGETDWRISAVADLNNDGSPDLVWHNVAHGWVAVWYMNGTTRSNTFSFPLTAAPDWKLSGPK